MSDLSFANVSLLLHGDGADGSTAIIDSSGSPKTVSRSGVPVIRAGANAYGGSHIQISSGNFLTVPNSSAFDLTSGAWTVEARVFPLSLSSVGSIFSVRAANQGFTFAHLNGNVFGYSSASGNQQTTAALTLNQYNHLAYSSDGTTFRMFLNGTLVYSSASFSFPWSSGLNVIIGASETTGQEAFDGYIEELRVTKGVARYTAAFTQPTEAFSDSATVYQVTGVIRDSTGALCARTVRLFRRDTGALAGSTVSNATTGVYTINSPTAAEVVRVVHSNTTVAPFENDLIDRVMPA